MPFSVTRSCSGRHLHVQADYVRLGGITAHIELTREIVSALQ